MRNSLLLLAVATLSLAVAAGSSAAAGREPAIRASEDVLAPTRLTPDPEASDAVTIPRMLSYQGRLTDSLGVPVPDTSYPAQFRLYTRPSGGSPFWTENQWFRTRDGLFHVLLGSVTPIQSLPDAGELYIGMRLAADPEMTPRVRIVSSGYCYLANDARHADTADYALAAVVPPPESIPGSLAIAGDLRGYGRARFGYQCDIQGEYAFAAGRCDTASGPRSVVSGGCANAATAEYATVGGGHGNKARGDSSTVGGGQDNVALGVAATVAGGTGSRAQGNWSTVGGGLCDSALGAYSTVGGGARNVASGDYSGVFGGDTNTASGPEATVGGGRMNLASGVGSVVGGGHDNRATGNYATVGGGTENTAEGTGHVIAGGRSNTIGSAVRDATIGGGVNNTVLGFHGTIAGGDQNFVGTQYRGTVAGGFADSVWGYGGFATNVGSRVPSGYDNAAAFNGKTVTASNQLRCGVLSQGSGSFTIDHPLDPYGRILNHYFIEGPEMLNIYRGSVVLDAAGRAEVSLPEYFSALNRNPMVQLTGVGTADVFVADKVSGNRFVVGGPAGAEVYWQVTGERKDVSAEATRRMMPVEQPKGGDLAGRMLDDEFISGCMGQLEREGKASGISFRTEAGRQRYQNMKHVPEKHEE